MFLNLSTTRTDGGWMYFKINNDDYMQLSGSDNKVNIYKDTAISGNLDVGQDQAQTSIKAYVNHAGSTGHVEMEARWGNQGYIHFKTNHTDGLLLFAVKEEGRPLITNLMNRLKILLMEEISPNEINALSNSIIILENITVLSIETSVELLLEFVTIVKSCKRGRLTSYVNNWWKYNSNDYNLDTITF